MDAYDGGEAWFNLVDRKAGYSKPAQGRRVEQWEARKSFGYASVRLR